MRSEFKTTQLRVRKNCIIAEGSGGAIFYATAARARALINAGAVDLVNAPGPSETKPMEPAEKKYSAAVQDGLLTATAPSPEPGKDALSSASAAALVSTERRPILSLRRGKRAKSE